MKGRSLDVGGSYAIASTVWGIARRGGPLALPPHRLTLVYMVPHGRRLQPPTSSFKHQPRS
jgi:hypothetical protein